MKVHAPLKIIGFFLLSGTVAAQPGRIYTEPDPQATGGLNGAVENGELTHALAVEHDRVRVFRAELLNQGREFRFSHLPIGKYDLVLVMKGGLLFEGLALGEEPAAMDPVSQKNFQTRVSLADAFFNRYFIHRWGLNETRLLALVERVRDKLILKQSGEKLNSNLRRLEIIELTQAADDWQMVETRHLYREEEPIEKDVPFFKRVFVPSLGGIRVVDRVKQLGTLRIAN